MRAALPRCPAVGVSNRLLSWTAPDGGIRERPSDNPGRSRRGEQTGVEAASRFRAYQ